MPESIWKPHRSKEDKILHRNCIEKKISTLPKIGKKIQNPQKSNLEISTQNYNPSNNIIASPYVKKITREPFSEDELSNSQFPCAFIQSGSEIRDAFINEKKLPNWYMREDIQQMILSEIKKGKKVFY